MEIKDIFENMTYGPAPESRDEALEWIARHDGQFGHFINGSFTAAAECFDSVNPATQEVLAKVSQARQADVDAAVTAARKAHPKWERLTPHQRARHLYALARLLQKHARLFAVIESLDNGKPIRESRDIDIPLAIRHFYHHAGLAQLRDSELPDQVALGVCGQIIPWNFPLLMLSWKVAPALAMGNTVVLKPAEWTSLSALLFAEICQQAGLPDGVVNIVTGDGAVGEMIVQAQVDKIAFTGSTAVGRGIRKATAGRAIPLTLELGGKSPYLVFEDADLDSAVEGVVEAIWFNGGQVCCAGSRLIVQEGIAERFIAKLRHRMEKLRVGDPLDKSIDMGAIISPRQRDRIASLVEASSGEVFQPCPIPDKGCFYPPTLVTGLSQADPLMQEEVFGPVLACTTFRTPAEAIQMANDTRYGLAASVWSENINVALDVAPKIAAGVIWVNGANMLDAAAPFGGLRESGFGREGGWEGCRAYTKAAQPLKALSPSTPHTGTDLGEAGLDRTAKLFIGGKQTRPDSGYSRAVYGPKGRFLGHVPQANRKDLRNAVEAARAAAGWSDLSGHQRAQILYYIAENLSARSEEFSKRINIMSGGRSGMSEVELSISRLFSYAAWADKFDGRVKGVPLRGVALAMPAPVGVIGAFCPDEHPLLGIVSVMAPIIAMGNRAVLVASHPFPLAALDLYQILETSDLPDGVVNILTADPLDLAPHMAAHANIDAVWSFSSMPLSECIETASADTLKRTWVNNGRARDWSNTEGQGHCFLEAATELKTLWIPYGA